MMAPRTKSSLLWGLVGGLAFLVLVQGYQLVVGPLVAFGTLLGVAVLVAVGATLLTYAARTRLPGNESP